MGRRKIVIQPLEDERNRSVTFLKRRAGLFKKAHELSVLCQVDIAVIVFGANQKLYEFSSTDTNQLIQRYQKSIPYEKKTPEDYNGKKRAGGHRATGSVSSIKSEPTDDDVDFEDDDDSKNVSQNATPQMPSNVTPQMAQSVTPQMPQNVTPQQMPPQQQLTPQQQQQQQMPHPHHPEQQRYYDYMSMGQMGQHPHQQQIMQQQMMQQQQHHHQMQQQAQQAQHQHHQQQQQQQQQQHQNQHNQHHKSQFTPISQEMSSLAGHLLDIRRGTNDIPPSSIPATAGSIGQGVAGAGSGYIPGSEGSSRVSSRQNSVTRPKLKVQIPGEKRGSTGGNAGPGGGAGQAGNSRSTSGEGTPVDAKEENTSHAALLLPPPSPSSYINNSGVGPGNPFAKPTLLNGEQTPLSAALPSRYINDLLPSPSNFYGTEWNFNPGSAGGSSFSAGGSLIPTSACKDKKRVDNSDDKLGVKKQRLG